MPSVKPGESEKDFVSRCIPIVMREHEGMENKQAVAICYSIYKNKDKKNEEILWKIGLLVK
jgi:hypothetical protein